MDRHIRLVDLHTGTLAQGTAAVMVIARTAAEAGALAPAFYMLGPERAKSVADSMRAAVVVIREPQPGAAVGRGDVIVSDMADPYVELIRDVNPKVRLVPRPPPI